MDEAGDEVRSDRRWRRVLMVVVGGMVRGMTASLVSYLLEFQQMEPHTFAVEKLDKDVQLLFHVRYGPHRSI